MGFLDKIKGAVQSHPDQAKQGLQKAEGLADKETGNKYSSQLSEGEKKAEGFIDQQQAPGQQPPQG